MTTEQQPTGLADPDGPFPRELYHLFGHLLIVHDTCFGVDRRPDGSVSQFRFDGIVSGPHCTFSDPDSAKIASRQIYKKWALAQLERLIKQQQEIERRLRECPAIIRRGEEARAYFAALESRPPPS